MALTQRNSDWLISFNNLYETDLGDSIDLNEFEYDDLYAFQVLKRAAEAGSPELRNIAAHVETRRKANLESVTLKSHDHLAETWKLDTPPGAVRAAAANRRGTPGLLAPDELLVVGRLKRLYELHGGGKTFDIARFAADDAYGRTLLREATVSPHPALAAIALLFYDENGQPKRHRRNRE